MLFTVNIDNDSYIMSLAHTKNDNIEIDESVLDLQHLNAYKLLGTEIVLDEEKLSEIIEAEQQEAIYEEIATLKKNLNDTDYIMAETFESIMALNNPVTFIADFIKVLADFKQQYSEALINRKSWRERIKELEK